MNATSTKNSSHSLINSYHRISLSAFGHYNGRDERSAIKSASRLPTHPPRANVCPNPQRGFSGADPWRRL